MDGGIVAVNTWACLEGFVGVIGLAVDVAMVFEAGDDFMVVGVVVVVVVREGSLFGKVFLGIVVVPIVVLEVDVVVFVVGFVVPDCVAGGLEVAVLVGILLGGTFEGSAFNAGFAITGFTDLWVTNERCKGLDVVLC